MSSSPTRVFNLLPTPRFILPGEIEERLPAVLWGVTVEQEYKDEQAKEARARGRRGSIEGDDEGLGYDMFSFSAILDIVDWILKLFSSDRCRLQALEKRAEESEAKQALLMARLESLESGSAQDGPVAVSKEEPGAGSVATEQEEEAARPAAAATPKTHKRRRMGDTAENVHEAE